MAPRREGKQVTKQQAQAIRLAERERLNDILAEAEIVGDSTTAEREEMYRDAYRYDTGHYEEKTGRVRIEVGGKLHFSAALPDGVWTIEQLESAAEDVCDDLVRAKLRERYSDGEIDDGAGGRCTGVNSISTLRDKARFVFTVAVNATVWLDAQPA